MKLLKVKILVPVLAVLFAITASAFTTVNNTPVDNNALEMQGYIYESAADPCHEVTVPCSISGLQTCFYRPGVVAKNLTDTSCSLPLKRN